MSESERLKCLMEGRFKTPKQRMDTFRSPRPASKSSTPDSWGHVGRPVHPASAPVQQKKYSECLPAKPAVPRCNAAASRLKAMRRSNSSLERKRPWDLNVTDLSRKNSVSEETPKAAEPIAGLQDVNITFDGDHALDTGSQNNLTFDMKDHGNLVQLAKEWSVNVADIVLVKSVFETYDVDKTGEIELHEFHKAVQDVQQQQVCKGDLTNDDLRTTTENHWKAIVGNRGRLSFMEFVRWYCSYGFSEDLLLTSKERWLRSLAKQQGASPEYISQIKAVFDSHDKDRSGEVDMEAFKQILYLTMKVPQHVGLPNSRVKYFWSQCDVDASGAVTFEEFWRWWMKYFHDSSAQGVKHMPFDDYYKNIRRIGHKFLDPPAYPLLSDSEDDLPFDCQ